MSGRKHAKTIIKSLQGDVILALLVSSGLLAVLLLVAACAVVSAPTPELEGPRPRDRVINLCEEVDKLSEVEGNSISTTTDQHWDRYIRWSPDGSRILFNNPLIEGGSLYGIDPDGTALWTVAEAESYGAQNTFRSPAGVEYSYSGSMMYFDVSPDGSRIVYSTCAYTREEPGLELSRDKGFNFRAYQTVPGVDSRRRSRTDSWAYNYEIVVSDIDGANAKRLTSNTSWDNFPAWSPDGTKIAYYTQSLPVREQDPHITIYAPETGRSDTITFDPEAGRFANRFPLAWSPDGERLAFVAWVWANDDTPTVKTLVYTVGIDGSGLTRVSEAASGPAWSPDGQRIAVVVPLREAGRRMLSRSIDLDVRDVVLYSTAADGTDSVPIADGDVLPAPKTLPQYPWMGDLSWSPGGSDILLDSFAHSVPLNGSSPPDHSLSAHYMASAWSPDGSKVAMLLGGSSDLREVGVYIMDRYGANIRALAVAVQLDDTLEYELRIAK